MSGSGFLTGALPGVVLGTFVETIRNRVLYAISLLGAGAIALSVSFGEWSVFARAQVMADFGLAIMSITGLVLALFVGIGVLGSELRERTVYLTLVRPVGRWVLVLGKYLGVMGALAAYYAFLFLALWGTLLVVAPDAPVGLLPAVVLAMVELSVIMGAAFLFSVLCSPGLASLLTLSFFVAGHYNDLFDVAYVESRSVLLARLLRGIHMFFPNLHYFNVRSMVVYGSGPGWEYIGWGVVYGVVYALLLLLFTWFAIEGRDL